MSDTKISAMPAASALSGAELLAGVQSGANVKITATQLQTLAQTGAALLAAANTFTTTQTITPGTEVSPLVLTGGALAGTTSRPLISMTQTWNNSGLTATGILLNVTNTSSNAASLLMDLQASTTSRFAVMATGNVGMGTAAPTRPLHVKSGLGGAGDRVLMESTTNSQASYDLMNTEGSFRIITDDGTLTIFDVGHSILNWTIDAGNSFVLNAAAVATNATAGFLYIATCNGTPTGTPTSYTGRVALVYDTSAHQFWIYDGSWKQPKTPAGAATVTWQ